MKQNKNKNSYHHDYHPEVCEACSEKAMVRHDNSRTLRDLTNAVLIVSLCINIFVFTLWLVMQSSATYAADITNFLVQ